jgi:hypothetical protein
MVILKVPTSNTGAFQNPSASVVMVRFAPVATFVTVTVALGITAPA